jgi:hypothetical protein
LAIGQQARPMFDSMAHDGVKRPGTREMTVMLAALMGLNSFAIDAMIRRCRRSAARSTW